MFFYQEQIISLQTAKKACLRLNAQLKNKLAAKDNAEADSYGASLHDNDSNEHRKQ